MKSLIALLLITLVSSNEMIETKIKLRRTADIELKQIVEFVKEYFDKVVTYYLQNCEKLVKYLEAREYEKFFIKIIQIIQNIKNYLSKYTFNELQEIFISYYEKSKTFNDFNIDFQIDIIIDIVDNLRAFIATIYFDQSIEKYISELRIQITNLKLYEFEAGFYQYFYRLLIELNYFNIKEQIKILANNFEREFKKFDEEKFKNELEYFKNKANTEIIKIQNEMDAFKNRLSEEILNLKLKIKTFLTYEDGDERLEKIVQIYTQIKTYIENFDIEQLLKIIKYILEKFISKITKKNLEPFFNTIKENIKALKDYIGAENYNYLIEYIDKLIESLNQGTEKIDISVIEKNVEKYLKTIKNFFKEIDGSDFIKQFKDAVNSIIDYIMEYNLEEKAKIFIDYCMRVIKTYYDFNFGFILTIYTLVFKTIQTLLESMPQVYNKNNIVIYGDDFFS